MPKTNNNYKRGANLERSIKAYYESIGYIAVRAAGSHGFADVWCTDGRALTLVQGKIGATQTQAVRILEEMIVRYLSQIPITNFPVAFLVIQGMTKGEPIILAQRVLYGTTKDKKSNKKVKGGDPILFSIR